MTALWLARLKTQACKHVRFTRITERTVADQHFALQFIEVVHQAGLIEVGDVVPQPIIGLTVQARDNRGCPLGLRKTVRAAALAYVDMIGRQLAFLDEDVIHLSPTGDPGRFTRIWWIQAQPQGEGRHRPFPVMPGGPGPANVRGLRHIRIAAAVEHATWRDPTRPAHHDAATAIAKAKTAVYSASSLDG